MAVCLLCNCAFVVIVIVRQTSTTTSLPSCARSASSVYQRPVFKKAKIDVCFFFRKAKVDVVAMTCSQCLQSTHRLAPSAFFSTTVSFFLS